MPGVIVQNSDGSTQKVEYNDLQKFDPLLYKQYIEGQGQPAANLQQTQATIPGTEADSKIKTVQAQQTASPLNLKGDLDNKMTLKSALSKYTALGMSADDVFKQYLSQSPHDMPKESPQELQELGIKPETLGSIGTPGSFMDRYNTKNAISGLRSLESQWHQTNALSHLPFLSNFDQNAKAYSAARQVFGQHLSTLIPGAPSAQGSTNDLMSTIPNVGDITQEGKDAGSKQFASIEDQLLKTKGYSSKDLGIDPRTESTQSTKHGGNLLTGLLADALNPGIDAINKTSQATTEAVNNPKNKGNLLQSILSAKQAGKSLVENAASTIPSDISTAAAIETAGAGKKLLTDTLANLGKKSTGTAVDNLPGALKTFINPKGAINQAVKVRDAVVNAASDTGKTINGNQVAKDIESWATKGKLGNLGQGGAIDQAVTDAKALLKGKKLDPKDIMAAYKEADSGFTKTGIPKAPIQANIDRGVRDVFAKYLNKAAPGWDKSTASMAKAYQAQKNPVRAGIKTLVKSGIPLAVPGVGGAALYNAIFNK